MEPASSTERSKKYRSDPVKRKKENERKKQKRLELVITEEELEERRKKAAERKRKSRESASRQKKEGEKVKDRNRKRNQEKKESPKKSTPRVKKHRNLLKVNLTFKSSALKRRKRETCNLFSTSISNTLTPLSPKSKLTVIKEAAAQTLSPKSTNELVEELVPTPVAGKEEMALFRSLSRKRDKYSNCTRQLVLNQAMKKTSKKTLNKTLGVNWTSLVKAENVEEILIHYKTNKHTFKPPPEIVQKVQDFYNRDTISRQLPYKNLTRKIKDWQGIYTRVAVRVMEVTLLKAYTIFQSMNPGIKISRRKFEKLRPKNIRLRSAARRLQCCCTYHQNMEYIRKSCNNVLIINEKEPVLASNESLLEHALCAPKLLKCILGACKDCSNFSKLNDLEIQKMYCSKSCRDKKEDCSKHTIKTTQYEQVCYVHKGKEKKKVQLVDKWLTPSELVELLKLKLVNFARHRFNVKMTERTYDEIVSNLSDGLIFKIHDFSENYTCFLPEEIQTLHWTQETVTVYPIVVLRKVGDDVREDHFVFVSEDKAHDVPFVEYCNEVLHKWYCDNNISVTHDIEYNDGCASQFKCIRAFASLARRPIKTTRVFTETSHGKSKSDGLGGVVKSYASRSVCGEKLVIRNAEQLHVFFSEKLYAYNLVQSNKPMLNRIFFHVPVGDVQIYRDAFVDHGFKYIQGTLKIHQVITIPGCSDRILYRKIACGCIKCLNGLYNECENLESFGDSKSEITITEHFFKKSISKKKKRVIDEDSEFIDLDDDEIVELDEQIYIQTEASKNIDTGDIAVIKTGDDHSYYLLKLISSPFETDGEVTDDYHHSFPPHHRVVEGNYLEIHKETSDGTIYYIDYKRKAMISAYCVVANCPTPLVTMAKRRGKMVEMYTVDNDLHQALCEIVLKSNDDLHDD